MSLPEAAEGLTRDDVLDNITITWLTNTALSGARLYWENKGYSFFSVKGVVVPVAVSVFPDELYPAPRSWAERAYPKLIHLQQAPQGRALCGLGTAEALFRRGSRGLQIAAARFFTRERRRSREGTLCRTETVTMTAGDEPCSPGRPFS